MKLSYLLLVCFYYCNSYSQLPSNLKGYFTFNNTLNDSMGLSSPAVNNGAVACPDRNNQINKAFQFNGTGSNIDISSDLNFGTTTIAFWFNAENVTSQFQLMLSNMSNLTQVTTSQIEIMLNYSKVEVWVGSVNNAPANYRFFLSNININPHQWYHISVVIDNNFSQIKSYLNGVLDLDAAISGLTYTKCSNTMRVGARSGQPTEVPFNGKLDEIMIFNKPLTSAEAKSIYSFTNGLISKQVSDQVFISPNPIKRNNAIEVKFNNPNTHYDITIYDMTGKEIGAKVEFTTHNSAIIYTEDLIPSMYIIYIKNAEIALSSRILITE
jgi:hypothetical protein